MTDTWTPPVLHLCRATKPAPDYLWSLLSEYDCSLDVDHRGDHEDETHGHTWPRDDWDVPTRLPGPGQLAVEFSDRDSA